MIVTAPFFVKNYSLLVYHDEIWTYVANIASCVIIERIRGIPIGVTNDETILIVYDPNSSMESGQVKGWRIDEQKFVDVATLNEDMLPEHHRFFFKRFDITLDAPATLVFDGTLKPSSGKSIIFSNDQRFNNNLSVGKTVYTLNSSPMFAFKSAMEYDADDYGQVTIVNATTGKKLFRQSLLWSAPIMLNHIHPSSQLTLVAADGVHLVNNDTGEAITVIEGKPFSRHYNWRGNEKIIDAVADPLNSQGIAILEHDRWYMMHLESNRKWTKANEHKITEQAHRISMFDSNIILMTPSVIRILTDTGRLQCEIPLTM